jgi:hypothetical protein
VFVPFELQTGYPACLVGVGFIGDRVGFGVGFVSDGVACGVAVGCCIDVVAVELLHDASNHTTVNRNSARNFFIDPSVPVGNLLYLLFLLSTQRANLNSAYCITTAELLKT